MEKQAFPIPANEKERLEALHDYNILDTFSEEEFDDIVHLASYIYKTPIALVSFIDEKRQWYKAKKGMDVSELPREETFCQHVIMQDDLVEVPDATKHPIFKDNPNVTGDFGVRFYAGVPLKSSEGYNIGTICVVDTVVKEIDDDQRKALKILAHHVMNQVEIRKRNLEIRKRNSNLREEVARMAKKELESVNRELESYKIALDETSGVIIFDKEGKITFVNDTTCSITKFKRKELIGKSIKDTKTAYGNTGAFSNLWNTINSGAVWRNEVNSETKDGKQYWVEVVVVPFLDSKGIPFKFVEIANDITDRKAVEAELIKAKEIAEKAIFVKDSFMANMSHEIRTPMNAIIGFTDLLARTELNEKQKEFVTNVQTAGDNLLLIINDILDLSKIESGKLVIEKSQFNLKHTLKHVYDLLKVKASQNGVEFNLFLDANMPETVLGDKGRINQVLMNLAGNALKFTEEGEVTISVKKIDDTDGNCRLKFSIKDTGIGIPEDKLNTIFERFTQAEESTTRRFGGTGLGLNIVKQLVELMDGELGVKSTLGKGSEFYFILDFDKTCESGTIEEKVEEKQPAESLGSLSIMLCEDNILNQHLAKNIIKGFGFDIDIANNGQEGIDLLAKNNYDLILMDLQMPVKDGYQTTVFIREELKNNVPIIAITAHSLIGEQQKCFDLGMNAYVSKPFKQHELLEKIYEVMEK
ncbi:ATP-binding protein [Flavobacterium beibuense]|uniref:histidine kinase n=1 Tax=Flavobacterium beibuense TaxID=657326 RepID=A0A444WGK6_9FLAO|nr:ATP-binding protein [Flavobacterium beibuense]RYJ45008.1 Multi-sensor hybrid histidine kinase [Flavobacterium beibuense]